jgi:hypothetical protein
MLSEKFKTNVDVEVGTLDDVYLHNDTVKTIYWDDVSVKLKDKHLLDSIDGAASAGQFKLDNGPIYVPISDVESPF